MQRKRAGNETAKSIEDRFAKDHDFLVINHDIDDALYSEVLGCVTEHKKNPKVVVLLITYGGSANVAYCPASAPMRHIGRVEEGRISGSS
jgi:hypothetical protein